MDYNKIDFNDEFDDDDEVCGVCGHDAMPPVGYNEEKDLLKFECPECGAIFIQDGDFNTTMVKGEARKWGKFLADNLDLPFEAIVAEASFEEVFGKRRKEPIQYKDVLTVISVDYESESKGVMVKVGKGKKKYSYPLIDLQPTDKGSANAKLLNNYASWHGTRYL